MEHKPETLEYAKYLHKVRKKNGDNLVNSTIERYCDIIDSTIIELNRNKGNEEKILELMNRNIIKKKSMILYSAFRYYLLYIGYDLDYDKEKIFDKLRAPRTNANAASSKRFLQSKVLSKGELKRLFAETEDMKMKLLLSMLYDTACRRDELLNIKFEDIVESNEEDRKHGIYAQIHIMGKGKKARTVYLTSLSYRLLNRVFKEKDSKQRLFIFYKVDGTTPKVKQDDALYFKIRSLGKNILDRHIHPHCFRHTKLTHMADDGADLLEIAGYAGHEDVSTSQIYIEISTHIGKRGFIKTVKPIAEV